MELKRLISHFTYRIEPKSEGGFIAHASDPSVPPLEAPTRAELQQKIQTNIATAVGTEFPGLKLPLENKEVNFAFHVEHAPDGGFILQSTDGKELPIVGSTHAEIESKFAEKLLGALGNRLMPEFSKALSAAGSGDVKVVVKRNVRFSRADSGPAGLRRDDSPDAASLPSADNLPLLPETNRIWLLVGFVLVPLIIAAIFYFLRHR